MGLPSGFTNEQHFVGFFTVLLQLKKHLVTYNTHNNFFSVLGFIIIAIVPNLLKGVSDPSNSEQNISYLTHFFSSPVYIKVNIEITSVSYLRSITYTSQYSHAF